ncbi:hypothetical protein ACJX0J_031190 [Zea mays]
MHYIILGPDFSDITIFQSQFLSDYNFSVLKRRLSDEELGIMAGLTGAVNKLAEAFMFIVQEIVADWMIFKSAVICLKENKTIKTFTGHWCFWASVGDRQDALLSAMFDTVVDVIVIKKMPIQILLDGLDGLQLADRDLVSARLQGIVLLVVHIVSEGAVMPVLVAALAIIGPLLRIKPTLIGFLIIINFHLWAHYMEYFFQ